MANRMVASYQLNGFKELLALLEKEGFTVLTANRDFEAIQLVQQHQPDLVLYDVMRPLMRGKAFHFVLQLSRQTSQIPLLFLAPPEAWEFPEVHYIGKPFAGGDVLSMVKRILSRNRGMRPDAPTPGTGILSTLVLAV